MSYYLVTAKFKKSQSSKLVKNLNQEKYLSLRPFGIELMKALTKARVKEDGTAVWEEEDYCSPPLAEERAAVLDEYFENIEVENVREKGKGWERIQHLPRLLPEAKIYIDPNEKERFGIPN